MQPHKDTVFAPNESGVDILRCYHTESEKRRFDVNLQYNWRFESAWERDWQIENS